MNIKILLISNMYPSERQPSYGIFVMNIERHLSRAEGITVDHVVIKGRGRTVADKLQKYLKFYLLTGIRSLFGDYDLCYAHYISHSFPPLVPAILFRKRKTVVQVHGSDIREVDCDNGWLFKAKRWVSSLAFRHADLVIVPSNHYKEVLLDHFAIDAEKIFVYASGGIDFKTFYPLPDRSHEDEDFVTGYVGRVDESKGVYVLVRALGLLKDKVPHLRSTIIGSGLQKGEMLSLAHQDGVHVMISFLDAMKQSELRRYYNKMDVFIFPSRAESLGLVGLEAMACGVPVIGSCIGGLTDYIVDGQNGFFFEPGNAQDLAEKILRFYALTSEEKAEMSRHAVATAQRYDSKTENLKLINKLKELVIR